MQGRTSLKDTPDKIVCPQVALIFDNPHSLGTSYGMFHPYPERRDLSVELFFLFGEFLPAFSGHDIGVHERFFKYRIQNEDEIAAVFLSHPETGRMVFLERLGLVEDLSGKLW